MLSAYAAGTERRSTSAVEIKDAVKEFVRYEAIPRSVSLSKFSRVGVNINLGVKLAASFSFLNELMNIQRTGKK
jgi:hypothetical protein